MIKALALLAVLFDTSLCLSEKGRMELAKAHQGIDLGKRLERLRNLGLKMGLNSAAVNSTSTVDETATAKVAGGEVSTAFGGVAPIEEVNRIEGIDEYLFDGDMILTEEQLSALEREIENPARSKRQIPVSAIPWPNKKVNFFFDTCIAVVNRQYIRTVLKYLQQRTCLNFVESATAPARIKVISGSGCYSFVGYLGREQELSLGSGCIIVGTVAHEFTHALGSMHTHMRSDRDKYVTVDLTNVTESYRNNFVKSSSSINSVPYEYGSDMHYQSNAFSTSGNSLKPAQPRFQRTMGSRTISFYDIRMINNFNKCHAACAGIGATGKCKNAGYPNPKNCNVCICPAGYGGAYCAQRPAGCGATLTAFKAWKSRNITIGNATITTVRDTYTTCSDWITAPAGKTVQFRITALKGVQCGNGCSYSSIEPRILADKAMTSPRICCPEQLNTILASNHNPAPIVAYSVYLQSTFTYEYRYI